MSAVGTSIAVRGGTLCCIHHDSYVTGLSQGSLLRSDTTPGERCSTRAIGSCFVKLTDLQICVDLCRFMQISVFPMQIRADLRICTTSARRLHDVCTTSARRGTTSSTSHLSPFAPFRVIPSLLELYWCHMHSKKQRSIQKEQVVPNHEYSEHGRVPSTRRLHGNRRLHEIYTKSARICINLHEICTNLQVCELDKAGSH